MGLVGKIEIREIYGGLIVSFLQSHICTSFFFFFQFRNGLKQGC